MQGLCAIGEALIDFIPQTKGKRLKDVDCFQRVAGGAPANVAGACAKLGAPARLLTQLGADAFGDYIVECCARIGIDTAHILRSDSADTALAFVSLAADGNRDFQFYRRNCADLMLGPDALQDTMLDACGILHFCSVSLVESPMKHAHERIIEMARERQMLISFDPNLRPSLWNDLAALKQSVWEFIPKADILKISDEELAFLCGTNQIEMALEQLFCGHVKLIIYTKGAQGACAYSKSLSADTAGLSVEVRDSTGAGDAFIGAFLYCLLREGIHDLTKLTQAQLMRYLCFANAYGALTTTRAGALDAMADADEFASFLSEQHMQIR